MPPFELGLLNIWICSAVLFFVPGFIALFTKTGWTRALTLPEISGSEKIIYYIWVSIQAAIYFYSIFVPFVSKPMWFYIGMSIFVSGMIIMCCNTYAYQTTPQNKLVNKGVYKISRNPGYFGSFLCYVSMGFLGVAWPLLLLAIVHFLLYQITVKYEERMCAKLWTDEFMAYRKKVPKNFLFF